MIIVTQHVTNGLARDLRSSVAWNIWLFIIVIFNNSNYTNIQWNNSAIMSQ